MPEIPEDELVERIEALQESVYKAAHIGFAAGVLWGLHHHGTLEEVHLGDVPWDEFREGLLEIAEDFRHHFERRHAIARQVEGSGLDLDDQYLQELSWRTEEGS